jgi:hypothetical protein
VAIPQNVKKVKITAPYWTFMYLEQALSSRNFSLGAEEMRRKSCVGLFYSEYSKNLHIFFRDPRAAIKPCQIFFSFLLKNGNLSSMLISLFSLQSLLGNQSEKNNNVTYIQYVLSTLLILRVWWQYATLFCIYLSL